MLTVGVVGAGGFIGHRISEVFCQQDVAEVRPIVRTASSAARFTELGVQAHITNATDLLTLKQALAGCDVVIHCVAGSPWFIRESAHIAYEAATQAGVKRLVYISTASVHGQAPKPGTDERSALSDRQFPAYNNAKVQAERMLQSRRGTTEVVIIRPGIVTGPGSRWVTGFVNALLSGTAYLGNQGTGICNSVYIDNLVEGIRLALTVPNANLQAFLVGDQETVTWASLYQPFASALGFELGQLPNVECSNYQPTWKEHLRERLRNTKFLGRAISLPLSQLKAKSRPPYQPPLNYEMAMLYNCQYKLPHRKAQEILGYEPIVSFAEGCDRTIEWLELQGYSVKH